VRGLNPAGWQIEEVKMKRELFSSLSIFLFFVITNHRPTNGAVVPTLWVYKETKPTGPAPYSFQAIHNFFLFVFTPYFLLFAQVRGLNLGRSLI